MSNNKNFTNQASTDTTAQNIDQLSKLLKDIQNPFTSYTQL